MRQNAREARQGPPARELLKEKWIVRLLLLGCGMGIVAQFTGVNAFMYYTPIILKSTGLGTSASIAATIGNGVVSVIATFAGIKAISHFGRRPMLITGLSVVIAMQLARGGGAGTDAAQFSAKPAGAGLHLGVSLLYADVYFARVLAADV